MDLRNETEDMQYCLQNAFIPEDLEKKIGRMKDREEQERLRKKVKGGSMAAVSVMQYMMTNRKHGFRKWPRDLKLCECAILKFFDCLPYDNYRGINVEEAGDLKEYSDLNSNRLKYYVNDELLRQAFEIVQGEKVTHILTCRIEEGVYEILKCFSEDEKDGTADEKGEEIPNAEDTVDADLLVMSHIILKNPILNAGSHVKKSYFEYLKKYIQLGGWKKRKYAGAQMKVYAAVLCSSETEDGGGEGKKEELERYRYFLLFDLMHILGYDRKILRSDAMYGVMENFSADFPILKFEKDVIRLILNTAVGNYGNWEKIKRHPVLSEQKEYAELIEKNLKFQNTDTFRILVTATMSAGKSTFINALAGKNVSLSQNMACTSKIHSVMSKVAEDGYTSIYDYELELMAEEEDLLHNNEQNRSDKIVVSTYYNGVLGGERVIINDSPGVNYSGEKEHREITDRMIREGKYDLLIYLLNATQLGTNDDLEHLRYVKSCVGNTPVLFVINKIDSFDTEEEDIMTVMQNAAKYIGSVWDREKPVVCPVSARAGYLVRISQYENLSKVENGELNGYIDKFEQMKVKEYYRRHYPSVIVEDSWKEKDRLLKNCGISYVEEMIKEFCEGGRGNGTGLCQV